LKPNIKYCIDTGILIPDLNYETQGSETRWNVWYHLRGIIPQCGVKGLFMVCHNLKVNDDQWNDTNSHTGSMAGPDENGPGHVFITTTDLFWKNFNVLTIDDLFFLNKMREAAMIYDKTRK
jgi:hypothetical protein